MKKYLWIGGIVIIALVAGVWVYRTYAQNQTSNTPQQTATVQRGNVQSILSSAGSVQFGQSAIVNWQTSGKVGQVLVKSGDQVTAGQELAVLDPSSLPASMINAQQNLIDAQKNLDDLENTKTQQAQAYQAVVDAQNTLDQLKQTTDTQAAQAQVDLANAQQAVVDAQKARTKLDYPHSSDPLVIQNAETNWLLAKKDYQKALQQFSKYEKKALTNPERALALKNLLTARTKMDQLFATYNWYLMSATDIEVAQADAALAQAQANLAAAQTKYDSLKNGPDSSVVAVDEAALADAQRQWNLVKDGPNPDDLAAAKAAVAAAQATLDQIHVSAPFAGTITDVNVNLGDLVSSGTEAFRIDDLSKAFVEIQASEVDVNNIKVGQPVTLTFDAIPDQEYRGTVTEVSSIGSISQGVVNYPVTVEIQNPDNMIKLGMTAAVNIVTNEHDDVLVVPNQAIRVSGGQRSVTVLYEGQQIEVPVTVGLNNGTVSEVNSDQLREGDTVVINGSVASQTSNFNGRSFGGGGPNVFFGGP
jgi:HlyD family secretion protein